LQYRRLLNFDTDFADGQVLASLIQQYIGSMREFDDLKGICAADSDFEHNAERMLVALRKIGLQTHLKREDLARPSQREMMLFVL
jgi:hypothetical protein